MTETLPKLGRGGRHALTREAVASSQRQRLLLAVAQVVAAKGFAAATVADVIAEAGVSRRTFYEQFTDLEACFLCAYQEGRGRLQARIGEATRALNAADWRQRVRASLEAYFAELAAEPEMAWTFSIEVMGAGRAALDERRQVMEFWVDQWSQLVHQAQHEGHKQVHATRARLLALVGGIEELVRDAALNQNTAALPALVDEATDLAIDLLT